MVQLISSYARPNASTFCAAARRKTRVNPAMTPILSPRMTYETGTEYQIEVVNNKEWENVVFNYSAKYDYWYHGVACCAESLQSFVSKSVVFW